jgi:hypothetical protein
MIKSSFAPKVVRYGDVLKIYIEAEDPEGDMQKIPIVANQAGYGRYPTDWVYLKSEYRSYLRGYLQWNTLNSNASLFEWTQVTLEVSILGQSGRESDRVVFPLQFVSETIPESPPPDPFHEEDPRLGYLDINLFERPDGGG